MKREHNAVDVAVVGNPKMSAVDARWAYHGMLIREDKGE